MSSAEVVIGALRVNKSSALIIYISIATDNMFYSSEKFFFFFVFFLFLFFFLIFP